MHKFILLVPLATTILLSSCASSGVSSGGPDQEQEPASKPRTANLDGGLAHKLGSQETADRDSFCTVTASAPSKSPLTRQQIQFYVERADFGGWSSYRFVVGTGASKSQAAVQSLLGQGLRQAASASAGTELAKLGDIKYGGEMRLTAKGNGGAEFVYNPPLENDNPVLSASEAAAFAELLLR